MYPSRCSPGGMTYTPLYVHAPVFVPSNAPIQGVPQQDQQQYPSSYVPQARQQMVAPVQVAYPTPCSSPSRLQPTHGIQPFYGPTCSSPPSVQGVRTDRMLTPWQRQPPPPVQGHQQLPPAYQQQQTPGHQPQPQNHQPHFQSLQPCPQGLQPRPQPPDHQLVAQSQQQHLQYKHPQPKSYPPQQPNCNRAMYYSQTTSTMVSYSSDSNQHQPKSPRQLGTTEHRGFGGNPSIKNQQAMYQKHFVQKMSYGPEVKDCVLPLTPPEKQRLFSQFQETLSSNGTLDVCDHRLLSIFMQLPAPIRRGIKRLGGLKVFLAEEFLVEGDVVSLRETSPTIQDDRSYDPAEWVESKTEDFYVTEFMKEPPAMKNRSEELDDGNLLEICSFLSDHFGDGGGYYDDYKALYPGGQTSFESQVKAKDKSPYSNLGNKLAAKAKQVKDNLPLVTNASAHIIDHQYIELKEKTLEPSSHSQRSTSSTEQSVVSQQKSPSPYATMGEKLATKAQEVRSEDIGQESNRTQHSNSVRQKHLFDGDLFKRNDSHQPDSQEIKLTSSAVNPKSKGDINVRPRMASMLSGHSTVEGQTDWILHLRSLADAKTVLVKTNELSADTEMVESPKEETDLRSVTASKLADRCQMVGVKTEQESDRERAVNSQTVELPKDEAANEQAVQLQAPADTKSKPDQDSERSASTTHKLAETPKRENEVTQQTDAAEDTLEDIETLSSGEHETPNKAMMQESFSDNETGLYLENPSREDDNCSETGEDFSTSLDPMLRQNSESSLNYDICNISGKCSDCADEATKAKVEGDQINFVVDLEDDLDGELEDDLDDDLEGNLEDHVDDGLEGNLKDDVDDGLEGNLDDDLEDDVDDDLEGNLEDDDVDDGLEGILKDDVDDGLEGNLEDDVEGDLEDDDDDLEGDLEGNLEDVDDDLEGNLEDDVDDDLEGNLEDDVEGDLEDDDDDLEDDDDDLEGDLEGALDGDFEGDLEDDLEGNLEEDLEGDLECEPAKVLDPTGTTLEETQEVILRETLALVEAVEETEFVTASLPSKDSFDMNASVPCKGLSVVLIEETPLEEDDQLPDSQSHGLNNGRPDQLDMSKDSILAEGPEASQDFHKEKEEQEEVKEAVQQSLPVAVSSPGSSPCLITEKNDSSLNLNAPFAFKFRCIDVEDEMTQEERSDPFHSQSQGHEESRHEALDNSLEEAADSHEEGQAVSKSQGFLKGREAVPSEGVVQSLEVAPSQEVVQSQEVLSQEVFPGQEVIQSQEVVQNQAVFPNQEVIRSQEVVQSQEAFPNQYVCMNKSHWETESVQNTVSVAASLPTSNATLITEENYTSQIANAPLPERCAVFTNQEVLITKIAVKTKDKGVNTDEIRMCTRAVSTRKNVERTFGVNTDTVIKEDRGVDTPAELEEAYMQKYINAVNRVKVLEATMEIERRMATSQKSKHSVEMQEARERLLETKQSQKSVEKELQVRRHQQTAELKKTTMELRELQGRFSNAKTKIISAEKLNSCLSSELESVTRQLLDLEASSLAREMNEVTLKHNVQTDTQELDEARKAGDTFTAEHLASLTQRAKTAELKVLEMKHQALEQKIASTLSNSLYTYNICTESSKISSYEKNQLATRFVTYEDTMKGHVSKLQSDYEALVQMIQNEDKVPDQLPELEIPSIDTFAVSVPRHPHVNLYPQGGDPSSKPSNVFQSAVGTTTTSPYSDPSPGPAMEGPVVISSSFVDSQTPSTVHGGGLSRQQRVLNGPRKGRGRGRRAPGSVSSDIRPGNHGQEGEDSLQAHPTKPASETSEADEMPSNLPLPDPTQQLQHPEGQSGPLPSSAQKDLPETPSGPGVPSMPPGLRISAGGFNRPPGLTENQFSETKASSETNASSETKGSKEATALTRAERIRNMQRLFSSGSSISRLRSKFSEGLHLHLTLGSHSGEFSARRMNAGLSSFKQPVPQVPSQEARDKGQQPDADSEGSPTSSSQGQESLNPISSASSSTVLTTHPDHEEVNKKPGSDKTPEVASPQPEVPQEVRQQEVSAPSQHVNETNQHNHQQPHQSHQQPVQHQSYCMPSQQSFYPSQRCRAPLPTPPPPLMGPQYFHQPAAGSFGEHILVGAYQNQQRDHYFHERSTGFPRDIPRYAQSDPHSHPRQLHSNPREMSSNQQGTASTESRMPQEITCNPQENASNPQEGQSRSEEAEGNPKEVQQMPSNPQELSSGPQLPLCPPQEKPLPGIPQHAKAMVETVESVPIMPAGETADKRKDSESGNPGLNLDDGTEPEKFEALLNQEINANTDPYQPVGTQQEAGIPSSRSRHVSCGPRSTTSRGNLVFGTPGIAGPVPDQNVSSSDSTSCGQTITAAQRISMEWKARNTLANSKDAVNAEIQSKASSTSPLPPTSLSSADIKQHPSVDPHVKSHQSTGTFFQQKTSDVNTRSFNFSSDRSKKTNLPPRFQAQFDSQKKQVQKPRLRVGLDHIAPLMSVFPGMAKSAEAEQGLKKRKSQDGSTEEAKTRLKTVITEEDDKTNKDGAKKEDADEWQTQMSKRKKRAMAQQAEQRQHQSQAGKAGAGSLDKLVGVLSKQFANVKVKELLDVIRQVRMDHNGSLSGMPLNTIIAESKLYLKTKTKPCPSHQTIPQTYTHQDGHSKGKELPTLQAIKQAGPLQEATDICVICQDDMSAKGGDVRMLDCGHLFHDECISKWYVTRERTCPVCRCHTLFVEDFPRLQ